MLNSIVSEDTAKRFVKFFGIGLSIYGINIGLTIFLVEILKIKIDIAYFITMAFIIIYSFIASFKIIFKVNFSYILFIKYSIALFSFSTVNYFITISFKNIFGEEYFYIIIIIITTLLSIMKFIVYNKFIFN